ncbi:geminin coiled-coil domain-containing protein 1, partial [Protopterus annectens]|uniref:geminin coiled-coil domain-containing protein 1 n=1 Tax=Protopterus annectens TaxID=7888 RepID=UPI001CFC3F09
ITTIWDFNLIICYNHDFFKEQLEQKNTVLSCQDQYFAGGQGYDYPYPISTSQASSDVSKDMWVSLWTPDILDNKGNQQESQTYGQYYTEDFVQEDGGWNVQLCSQLHKNKELQETLQQKEEELARLHEENNKLKQYLNSAFVKSLEEKAKKLLLQNRHKAEDEFKTKKRKCHDDNYTSSQSFDENCLQRARRNLFRDFTACEENPDPPIDTWVLRTLGLKDVNTIDESSTANYSAISSDNVTNFDAFSVRSEKDLGYCIEQVPSVDYSNDSLPQMNYPTNPSNSEASCIQQNAAIQSNSVSVLPNVPSSCYGSAYYASPSYPNKTEVAFSTSVTHHRNVKTHTFQQGQAFVRRDEEGGWKFTWVPRQSD